MFNFLCFYVLWAQPISLSYLEKKVIVHKKNFGKFFKFAKVKKLNKRVVPQLKFRTEQFRVDV